MNVQEKFVSLRAQTLQHHDPRVNVKGKKFK